MESRSLAREVALIILGQISDEYVEDYKSLSLEKILNMGLDTLMNHWREQLDDCALQIELAQEELLKSESQEVDHRHLSSARKYLINSLKKSENILNILSDTLEFSRLLTLCDQEMIRKDAINRVEFVMKNLNTINSTLDNVMEGWRLRRLPRIDQDILRLAYVDLYSFNTPIPVTCNEAVNLANRYSDEQGRKMINGILRRLQNISS